jgi:hypothetical protein
MLACSFTVTIAITSFSIVPLFSVVAVLVALLVTLLVTLSLPTPGTTSTHLSELAALLYFFQLTLVLMLAFCVM